MMAHDHISSAPHPPQPRHAQNPQPQQPQKAQQQPQQQQPQQQQQQQPQKAQQQQAQQQKQPLQGPAPANCILEGRLFLGNVEGASCAAFLQNLRVTHVVNAAREIPNFFPDRLKYYRCDFLDIVAQKLDFDGPLQFIHHALSHGGVVLVHCRVGASRSAAVVVGFLMVQFRLSFRDALAKVKARRPCVKPNNGFLQQLAQLEARLTAQAQEAQAHGALPKGPRPAGPGPMQPPALHQPHLPNHGACHPAAPAQGPPAAPACHHHRAPAAQPLPLGAHHPNVPRPAAMMASGAVPVSPMGAPPAGLAFAVPPVAVACS